MTRKTFNINAFTLLEIILVLIISAIVVSLVFSVILNLKKTFYSFYTKQERVLGMLQFKNTIERDIDDAIFIVTSNEKDYIMVSAIDSVVYNITDHHIVRNKDNHNDTFFISSEILNVCYVTTVADKHLVKSIMLKINDPVEITNVSFLKNYTSADLMAVY